ncbi:MAG: carbohydrate ABC transporter permease [Treponema sp.]|jgi:multiple sugar transport system permease protein|nr:carbohydrate ABC transporter permease [Treponema sp.]
MQRKTTRLIGAGMTNLIIILLGCLMLYPVVWLIMASFKEGSQIFSDPSLLPKTWSFQNYAKGWEGIGIVSFSAFFANSFTICILCVIFNAIFCSLTAYAFGRLEFKGRKLWFALMMVTLMLPGHATTIPQYLMFRNFGWVNTFLPFVIPKLFATDAFFIFLLVQFIRGLPKDMDESARIDGCGKFRIYWSIVLPLSVPAIITTVLFTFLWTWDDFFKQMLYLNSPEKYTVPMGLRLFLDASGASSWGPMFAMSVLSLAPCFILFFSLQKYFVQGIATTGIKG